MKKILFILTIFIFCIGACCIYNYPDNDIWARLITGAHSVETLSILKHDFLSYTPTHTWYDHEWGASVIFYLILKYFGNNGLILFKGIITALTVFMCFKTVELRAPKSTVPYNILYFAMMFLVAYKCFGAIIRCLIFTCLFFSIFIYILEKARVGNKKMLIILPFLMVLWGNIHGGCLSGLGLLSIYIIGEFLNRKTFKEYIYTFLGCFAALFVNPYGFNYVKFLFFAATMDRKYISEWGSSFDLYNFKKYMRYKLYFFVMILTQILYIIKNKINYKQLDKTKILLILVTACLSFSKARHQTFFIFTAGTFLYDEFYSLFNCFINSIRKKLKIENETFISIFSRVKEIIVYFFLLILTLPMLVVKNKEIRITETAYPRFAIEFVKINQIKGNLLINFDWGSYAAYKLYPNNLIAMDGRYEEVYNTNLLLEMLNFHLVKDDWYKIVRDYKTDVIILEKKYPVFNKMLMHPDWKLVFENNLSGVFVPASSLKDEYLYPVPDDEYYNKNIFYTDIKYRKKG